MEIVEAILGGERDPRKLAKLKDPRIRADEKMIAESLHGHWKKEHIFKLSQAHALSGQSEGAPKSAPSAASPYPSSSRE